ncbi:MAG TPA: MFS transporter, partial [Opitutus sp.]|nr:MFS transporter [Opitutus sp.]
MQDLASPAPLSNVTAAADKVPLRQKVAYGLGTFHDMWGHWLYTTIGFQVFNIFLGVAPWLIGVALFANRLFDAIADPLFGWLSDNTRTRWGRRRPFILVGGILAGLCLPLLVAVAPGWGSSTFFGTEIPHYFWFMLISSAIFLPIMSSFNLPW